MKFIYKILVPTDFSDLSLAAMEYATSFSKIYEARIYFIHVVEEPSAFAFHTVEFNSETALRDVEESAMAELKRFLGTKLPEMRGIVPVIRRGDVCREIVQYAEGEEFDVIIMATHGHTGLAHMLMGSTAEKVVRHSKVPVMTVKPESMHYGIEHEKEESLESIG